MGHLKKMLGDERREWILRRLRESEMPIPARTLAQQANVSRQVIVQDVSILKARNEPLVATSQGYLYLPQPTVQKPRRVVVCQHTPERTEEELNLMVDYGATVLDVIVEHPIYGQITASLMIRSRKDVQEFIANIKKKQASLLSNLTEGVHLHTLEADREQQLDELCEALEQANILLTARTE